MLILDGRLNDVPEETLKKILPRASGEERQTVMCGDPWEIGQSHVNRWDF